MDNQVIRFFVVCVSFLFFSLTTEAQLLRTIEVKAEVSRFDKKKNESTVSPLRSAHILGFLEYKDAKKFLRDLKDRTKDDYRDDCDAYVLTDNEGLAVLDLPLDGGIVCIPRESHIDPKLGNITHNATCTFFIQAVETEMDQVESVAKRKEIPWKKAKSPRVGNRITQLPIPYPIPADWAKDNGRFGLSVHFIGLGEGDTLCHWRPFLKDGVEFRQTQYRRMGYEMVDSFNNVHDVMGRFVSRYPMSEHKPDSVMFSWDLLLPNQKYYRALADIWAEDYNGVFRQDTVELFDGYSPVPLRFLDFRIDDIPIESERYEMRGKMDEHESNLSLHFNFLSGQAELDPNDSINYLEQQKLLDAFKPAYNDPSNSRFRVRLQGKASPEGPTASNERLSKERAQTIATWLANQSGFSSAQIESLVTPWSEVADTLERMGESQKAEDIRQIVSKYKTIEQQNTRVYALPYYRSFLNEVVLPKFRVVNFSFSYIVKRPLKKEEVIEKYEKDENYRKTIKSGYEYMFLFDHLQNRYDELEEQSRQAYQHIKESALHPRPWPLAAYHYSRCLTRAKRPDVDILGPYFHKSYGPNKKREDESYATQWWNDEAIVVAEIGAYCEKGDYGAANFIVLNYLPDDPRFDKLRLFMECYDNHYTEKRVIDAVASTSSFNKAVIYAAQDEEEDTTNLRYLREAWRILSDSSLVSTSDPRVLYLRGSLGYRLFKANKENTKSFFDGVHFIPRLLFDEERWIEEYKKEYPNANEYTIQFVLEEEKEEFYSKNADKSLLFGWDIIQACRKDDKLLYAFKYDGYFNKTFRKTFNFFWKGLQNGKDIYELEKEWDALDGKEKT